MTAIEEINENNFENKVIKSQIPVLVDFYAQWCGPCRKIAPVLEQIKVEFKDDINVFKIDSDKNINTAKEYGISSLPSVLIFVNGAVEEVMVGLMPKSAIVSNIKKFLN